MLEENRRRVEEAQKKAQEEIVRQNESRLKVRNCISNTFSLCFDVGWLKLLGK